MVKDWIRCPKIQAKYQRVGKNVAGDQGVALILSGANKLCKTLVDPTSLGRMRVAEVDVATRIQRARPVS